MYNTSFLSEPKTQTGNRFPGFLVLLFFVEMWERYSYYGMRALLILFLTKKLGLDDKSAIATYSLFVSLAFAGPVIGGIIADKIMGFRNMVIAGGVVISLGHLSMSFAEINDFATYLGLGLIAVGTGLFKGNITNLLGVCYKDEDKERGRGFTLFYVGINLGSVLAVLTVAYVQHTLGWHYGFGLAGVGMLIGLSMFIIFTSVIEGKGLAPRNDLNKLCFGLNPILFLIIGAIAVSFLASLLILNASTFFKPAAYINLFILCCSIVYVIFAAETKEQKTNLLGLIVLTIFFLLFFGGEMQLGSLFNLLADRNVDLNLFGHTLPSSLSQSINPFSIVVFGLLISNFAKFDGSETLRNFAIGLFSMTVCSFIIYLGCTTANENGLMSVIYLIISISFMGLGEVCLAPCVSSQASLLAPKKLKGFVMGIVMLSLSCSNSAGLLVQKYMSVPSVKGEVNPLESLAIYNEGFFSLGVLYLFITVIFILIAMLFLRKIINNKKTV
jgi:POT family proton-dependent oligopeptide transporter